MPLLDAKGLRNDVWARDDGAATHAIVDLAALDATLAARGANQRIGVEIANTSKIEALKPLFNTVDLISIPFPGFGDGRGFSLAKLLREAGYHGVLRAHGPLIADQFAYALACGFDEIELPDTMASRQPVEQWLAAEKIISHGYQRNYATDGNILDQRRAARRRGA